MAVKERTPRKVATAAAAKKAAKKAADNVPVGGAQRMLVDDAFPDRDQHVEDLIVEFRRAEAAAEAALTKANDRVAVAQKSLKEAVRELGLDKYSSYDSDDVVELKHRDDQLKVRKRKKKEAMPTAAN